MTIYPHDHVLRYRFESDARPDIAHVVDLAGFDSFGECSCEDFCFRIRPVLLRNRSRSTPAADVTDERQLKRCKHILAAREHLVNSLIDRITEGERDL